MPILVDTSFVHAVISSREKTHHEARETYLKLDEQMLLPTITLPELAFLASRIGGNAAAAKAMRAIRSSKITMINLALEDYDRASAILEQYQESRIDFVDACLMAIAERLNITRVLTYDRRDSSLFRPAHCEYFELLP